MKPFKSERAAKIAMTKAERAYIETPGSSSAYRDAMNTPGADPVEESRKAEDARKAAYEHMSAVYENAKASGFYVRSWYFGTNATRDLIAANMD